MEKRSNFKVGDSIIVKKGTKDPEIGYDIGGWQGRIFEIWKNEEKKDVYEIVWDSVTLKDMPSSFIKKFDDNDWDWARMDLYESEIEPAQPRDTEDDVWEAREKAAFPEPIEVLGVEGKNLMDALDKLGLDQDVKALREWWNKLRKEMQFPFEAKVNLFLEEEEDLKQDDIVQVTNLDDLDNFLGVMVTLLFGGERYFFPLSDLEATDKNSPNYKLTLDYREWYANR